MKSWHYVGIFVIVLVVIGGIIFFNASSISDIDTEITKTGRSAQDARTSNSVQSEIDVLADNDFESDDLDLELEDDLSDFDDLDELFGEDIVAF